MNCRDLFCAALAVSTLAGALSAQAESLFVTPVAPKARPAFLPATGVAPIAFNGAASADLRLNLVASGSLPGTDGRTISQILNLYNPARPEYLRGANIAELRDLTGADLVAILVPQDSVVNAGLCGEANLPMLQRDLAAQAHEMLSVTASGPNVRGSDFSCRTDAIFVHELGHNFGLMHDRNTLVTQGAPLEVRTGTVLMCGYIYGSNGKPAWLIATGPVTNNVFTGSMLTFANGQTLTGAYRVPTLGQALGNITVTFDEPDYATIDWPGGSIPIVRQNYEDDHDNTSETTAPYEALGDSGWWWNPAESGRGYTLEIQADTLVIACYMYDAAGDPVWFLGTGKLARFNQFQGKWIQLASGQTIGGACKAPSVVSIDAGDLAIDFATFSDATLTLPDGRKIPITRQMFQPDRRPAGDPRRPARPRESVSSLPRAAA